jgi:hypothetical protein
LPFWPKKTNTLFVFLAFRLFLFHTPSLLHKTTTNTMLLTRINPVAKRIATVIHKNNNKTTERPSWDRAARRQ